MYLFAAFLLGMVRKCENIACYFHQSDFLELELDWIDEFKYRAWLVRRLYCSYIRPVDLVCISPRYS